MPFYFRVLGAEIYGKVLLAQAVVAYSAIFVHLGTDAVAVKRIVNDPQINSISAIATAVYASKIFLFTFVLGALAFVSFQWLGHEFLLLLLFSTWVCLFDILHPIWLFQGLGRYGVLIKASAANKMILIILVFTLVKGPGDYLLVPICGMIATLVTGVYVHFYLIKTWQLSLVRISLDSLVDLLKESLVIFGGKISQFYVKLNKLVVGFSLGTEAVAFFDLGEKVLSLLKMPAAVMNQALFPRFARRKDKNEILEFFCKMAVFNMSIMLGVMFSAHAIVLGFTGSSNAEVAGLVALLAVVILPVTVSNFFGLHSLLVFGFPARFSAANISGGLVYLVALGALFVVGAIDLYSLAACVIAGECASAFLAWHWARWLIYLPSGRSS